MESEVIEGTDHTIQLTLGDLELAEINGISLVRQHTHPTSRISLSHPSQADVEVWKNITQGRREVTINDEQYNPLHHRPINIITSHGGDEPGVDWRMAILTQTGDSVDFDRLAKTLGSPERLAIERIFGHTNEDNRVKHVFEKSGFRLAFFDSSQRAEITNYLDTCIPKTISLQRRPVAPKR